MKYLRWNDIPWREYDVIGFDMDGTLYDEMKFIEQVYRRIAIDSTRNIKVNSDDILEWMIIRWKEKGSSYPFIFSEALNQFEIKYSEFNIENCLEIYRSFKPELNVEPHIANTLMEISRQKNLFLITDGNFKLQRNKFEALNLTKWFKRENTVFTGEFGSSYYKPNLQSINNISCLENTNERVLYLGDREIDEKFAAIAGFSFVKVERFNEFWSVK